MSTTKKIPSPLVSFLPIVLLIGMLFATIRTFGSEANVAVSLAHFGIPTEFVTRLPDNAVSRACSNKFISLRKAAETGRSKP